MGSVLDPELRLRGIDGLRVADASAFPLIPSPNIQPAVMLVAERAAGVHQGRSRCSVSPAGAVQGRTGRGVRRQCLARIHLGRSLRADDPDRAERPADGAPELANPIQLVFLNGLDRLSDRYKAELRDLGYRIHDASALVAELSPPLALFAERWKSLGTIRHYCLMRFPVMRRLFAGKSLITFDGDMIVNAPFCEIARTLGSGLYLLGGSSCFAAIPAETDFFAVLEDQVDAITRDPDAYARDVAGLQSADEFFTRASCAAATRG